MGPRLIWSLLEIRGTFVEAPMQETFLQYVAIGITALLALGLGVVILVLNALLGPKRPNKTKEQSFECGNPRIDDPRKRFNVKYYLAAIAFVVFDIEAVFLFPWAVKYRDLLRSPDFGVLALGEALVFIGVLAVGLWYVVGKGVLDWGYDRTE